MQRNSCFVDIREYILNTMDVRADNHNEEEIMNELTPSICHDFLAIT